MDGACSFAAAAARPYLAMRRTTRHVSSGGFFEAPVDALWSEGQGRRHDGEMHSEVSESLGAWHRTAELGMLYILRGALQS